MAGYLVTWLPGYLVPADAVVGKQDTMIAMTDLQKMLDDQRLKCLHFLLILDCCFAGSFRWAERTRFVGFIPKKIYKERYERYIDTGAWQVFTSAATDEKALDMVFGQRNQSPCGEHSIFAQALIEALDCQQRSPADYIEDGIITLTELYLFVRDYLNRQLGNRFRQSPQLFPLQRHDKGEFLFLDPNHPLNLPTMADLLIRNPYKGLSSYELSDQHLYFGREEVAQLLFEKVNRKKIVGHHWLTRLRAYRKSIPNYPLIVVTGASGSGKSSLVKAGLVPLLLDKGYTLVPEKKTGEDWMPIRPGNGGLAQLKAAREKLSTGAKVILLIDQFEEVITQIRDKAERAEFMRGLYEWLSHGHQVLVTIRADFEPLAREEFIKEGELNEYAYMFWKDGRFVVPVFNFDDLRKTIVRPAIQALADFENEDLVDDIIKEVIGQHNSLPLLSHTLSLFYDQSAPADNADFYRVLKVKTYKKLGGVYEALRITADDFYSALNKDPQSYVQQIMLRMITQEGAFQIVAMCPQCS
jgi:hypothetical protein